VTDWSALKHAYGPATDVPSILAALTPDAQSEAWNELWSRVCHQGTVYSASYATLPYLRELATAWQPSERFAPLCLAGAIVASRDVFGAARPALVGEAAELVRDLRHLALESLPTIGDATEFIYVLQAVLAFDGEAVWGRHLDRLAEGAFKGNCPACGATISLVIGKYGFFATNDAWFNKPEGRRTPVRPASAEQLPQPGRWLFDQTCTADQTELGSWIRHLFGATHCPVCGATISVAEAVVAFSVEWDPHPT
jgi:hypothetical protein